MMADQQTSIMRQALRVARIAAIENAPSGILLDMVDRLVRACEAQCTATGVDPAEWRRGRAIGAEQGIVLPLTEEEEAELDAEEAAFDEADTKARTLAGYSETEWGRLDGEYRFGLIMDQYYKATPT
jgi:hypothetical protein